MKEQSKQAQTAKAIRKDLKASFPNITFSVKSRSFSMGDSVDVNWTNGPTRSQVSKVIGKYQYGNFNSMTDSYEYTNDRRDLPQVKYVQISREISDDVRLEKFNEYKRTHQVFELVNSIDEDSKEFLRKTGFWNGRQYVSSILADIEILEGALV